MKLKRIARIRSGHLARRKIEPRDDGAYFLLQGRDVNGKHLYFRADNLIKIDPVLSKSDWVLKKNDVLFMARGAWNYSVMLQAIPEPTLAAACFFVIRVSHPGITPMYLCWYLNQEPARRYFNRQSGRGVHMPVVRRSVLENIDVPMPSLEKQNKIIELNKLMEKEQCLLKKISEKRKLFINSLSINSIKIC